VQGFTIRANYPNRRSLRASYRDRGTLEAAGLEKLPGHEPAVAEYVLEGDPTPREAIVRDVDLPLLCRPERERAREHLALLLEARAAVPGAAEALERARRGTSRRIDRSCPDESILEDRFVVPSTSTEPHPATAIGDKGSVLLRLSQLGYPVPDFVILTSDAYLEEGRRQEENLGRALDTLQQLAGQTLGSGTDPLVFAFRVAIPYYVPGFMPTYLNVGVTETCLPGLRETFGPDVTNRIFLNTLRNLLMLADPESYEEIRASLNPRLGPAEVSALIDRVASLVRRREAALLDDPYRQAAFFLDHAHRHFESNSDILLTLARGKRHYPSVILQKMVCSLRDDASCAGVLFSRHSWTGQGHQLQVGHNVFGEEIMTGTIEAEEIAFEDRRDIKERLPAVYHFVPHLNELEREFESPVQIEFATENCNGVQLFAVLQLNRMEMSGRAAFISVVSLHREGSISRERVTELICPYHVKQIEADAIDVSSLGDLEFVSQGVPILPRGEVTGRIYFGAEAALRAKKRGETVCFCKRTFEPADTVVMREMDAIVSLTAAAIHVVTICQSFGVPALLSLERSGVTLTPDDRLENAGGVAIAEGDWVTISSFKHAFYKGKARLRPARLVRYMRGETVELSDAEKPVFAEMAYAYRYYQQFIRGLKLDQISRLNELIRLVNLEFRGEVDEARGLVRGWFDDHERAYVEEVFASDMGDHLNQHTLFDMLTLERKVRFYRAALEKCRRERLHGYTAGAFMLGRFISLRQSVTFWRSFAPWEIALLVNEWVLFEKYMLLLHRVGERKIVHAKTRILQEGLGEIPLETHTVKPLVPLKLTGVALDAVASALPEWGDRQSLQVLELLKRPYGDLYDYQAPWSVGELERICREEGLPVPERTAE
jgi:hypothetical protein